LLVLQKEPYPKYTPEKKENEKAPRILKLRKDRWLIGEPGKSILILVSDEKELSKSNLLQLMKLNPTIKYLKKIENDQARHSVMRRKFFDNLRDESIKKNIIKKERKFVKEWMNKIKF
jgi:hypothetical protein